MKDDPQREQIIAQIVRRIAQHGLTQPALLFLEAHRPLGFLGAQALVFLQPLFGIDGSSVQRYAQILEDPEALEQLIEALQVQDID